LEIVKAKRSDLEEFCRRYETVQADDITLIIGRTPEITSRIKNVFGDTSRIRHVKLEGKFFFAAVDLAKIALWNGDSTPDKGNISHYIGHGCDVRPNYRRRHVDHGNACIIEIILATGVTSGQIIDDVTLTTGMRVLLKSQTK